MKEAFDKVIERLEEVKKLAYNTYDNYKMKVDLGRGFGVEKAIEIVNQLAEEYINGWTMLTDDEESYPEPFEYVLVEDEFGDKNVACCYPDYDWHISNGENSLKLNWNVVKWKKLSD